MSDRPNINLNFYDVHNPGFTVINSSVGAAYEEDRRRLGVPGAGADPGHESDYGFAPVRPSPAAPFVENVPKVVVTAPPAISPAPPTTPIAIRTSSAQFLTPEATPASAKPGEEDVAMGTGKKRKLNESSEYRVGSHEALLASHLRRILALEREALTLRRDIADTVNEVHTVRTSLTGLLDASRGDLVAARTELLRTRNELHEVRDEFRAFREQVIHVLTKKADKQ